MEKIIFIYSNKDEKSVKLLDIINKININKVCIDFEKVRNYLQLLNIKITIIPCIMVIFIKGTKKNISIYDNEKLLEFIDFKLNKNSNNSNNKVINRMETENINYPNTTMLNNNPYSTVLIEKTIEKAPVSGIKNQRSESLVEMAKRLEKDRDEMFENKKSK